MELRHLRYFVAVAEALHFGRAAQQLHMAQQPLSRQIRNLEAELGVELFHRTKRTVRLTEVGEAFLLDARKTLAQAEQAISTAQRVSRGEAGELMVGFTGPSLNGVLPALVRQFRAIHPDIKLMLTRLQTNEQIDALLSGHIQAGLLHPPIPSNGLHQRVIHREGLIAVLPDTHPLAQTDLPISVQELAHDSFILFPRLVGPTLYDQIISFCNTAGFSPNVVQEALPQQTILGLVATGIGVSLIHTSVQQMGQRGVVAKPLIEKTPLLKFAIAWHPEATNPALPHFLNITKSIFAP